MSFTFAAERVLDAPADLVYHLLSDYQTHHRHAPGFLPPTFTRLDVLEGGVGAGTVIRFTMQIGGREQTRTQRVTEPEPGRVLRENGDGEGSTFIVEPRGAQTHLRIETVLQTRGIEGVLIKLFGARILAPLYQDEMQRIEQHARAHDPRHPLTPSAHDPRESLQLSADALHAPTAAQRR